MGSRQSSPTIWVKKVPNGDYRTFDYRDAPSAQALLENFQRNPEMFDLRFQEAKPTSDDSYASLVTGTSTFDLRSLETARNLYFLVVKGENYDTVAQSGLSQGLSDGTQRDIHVSFDVAAQMCIFLYILLLILADFLKELDEA